ncbi:MAG: histidine kinase dimerization/phosphoacceptor domain -containing protein [Thermodesulfobacteriota bacterium]
MPTVVMLAVGAALVFSYRSHKALEEKRMAAYRISDAMSDLNEQVRSYVLHHEERPRQQFLLKHQEVTGLVVAARFEGPQRQLLTRVGAELELMEALFWKLILSHERLGSRGDDALSREAEERLAGQLLIRSSNARTEASRLVAMIGRDINAGRRRIIAFVLVFMGLIAAAQFGVLTGLTRSIAFSLEKLRKGAEAVETGGLDHRIGIISNDEFGDLARDFDRMSGKLQATTVSRDELSASEQRYATTLASIGDAVIATDVEGRIAFMNAVAEELTGWSRADAAARPVTQVFRIINEHTRNVVEDPVAKVLRLGMIVGLANHTLLVRKDGTEIPIDDSGAPIRSGSGQTTGVVLVFRDIVERRRAEEALRASLADKDVLMRELAHRTKNNMQMIASLLSLQATASSDDNFVRAVSETQGRIRAMSLVHENLYQAGNIASMDIKDYVENLLNILLGSRQAPEGSVRANLEMEELFLSVDGALPCGLIINELVSNSLKHAFAGGKSGNIFLSLRRVGENIELRYRDDGPGLPRDLDLSRVKSLGLKLVHGLAVRQLRGTMEIRHDPVWEIVFTFGRIAHVERM